MSEKVKVLWLSQNDVIAAGGLDMATIVNDVEEIFRLSATGDYVLPRKVSLQWEWEEPPPGQQRNHLNLMSGYIGGRFNAAGFKAIASFPRNPFKQNLPRASALIVLHDTEVGLPMVVMDGTLISAMRTGAVTGVGAKYLAREDVTKVGLIGAGVQNRTQLMALRITRPGIQQALVFDIRPDRSGTFAAEMSERLGLDIHVAGSAEEVVRQAEVLVTATTNVTQPIVHDGWLAPGSFYAHVSGYECEYDVIRHADKVLVDDWDLVKNRMYSTVALMWRDGEFADDDLYAEFGEVVGSQKPGRENDREVIIFSPIGLALNDVAVASHIYETARSKGLGQKVTLWDNPLWV
ncbi:MAG: ornithine cyclodeaminase family protein [Chloroflexota bacterium]|nr:ornithine cyclodeaminase family protein [Chloroflexota bacterium]